jgi:glycosyltransferase involved in cell wall biosynthesis
MDQNLIHFQLPEISEALINNTLQEHSEGGGNEIDKKLLSLFEFMGDNKSVCEVTIKVAALNTIYATAINYIKPVVAKIVEIIPNDISKYDENDFVKFIDNIAFVSWKNESINKEYSRINLSFASKYVHFLSKRKMPIYDSYMWIIMVGYFNQYKNLNLSFAKPADYSEFFQLFNKFKAEFNLGMFSNFEIDKFLWHSGKIALSKILKEKGIKMGAAKSKLKKQLKP